MTQVRVARPQLELSPIAASLFGAMVACAVVLPLAGFRSSPAPALAAAFVGAAVCFVALELWRQGLGSLGLLFVVGLAYYHIVIPVEYLIDPTVPMFLLHYYPSLTEQDLIGPLLATDLGLAGFLLGYAFRHSWAASRPATLPLDERRILLGSAGIFAVGVLLYITMSYVATGSFLKIFASTYRERDELFYGYGALGFGIYLVDVSVTAAIITLLWRGERTRSLIALGLLGMMVAHAFIVGARAHVLYVGIGTVAGVYATGRRPKPLLLLLLAALLLAPLSLVTLTRGKQTEGLGAMSDYVRDQAEAEHFNPANNDAHGPYLTLVHTIATLRVPDGLHYGETYLRMITILPPRFLYPNRPQPLDEDFSHEFRSADSYANSGFAFSGVAEAYLNFGYAGPFLVFFVVGLLLGAFRDRLEPMRGTLAAGLLVGASASSVMLSLRNSSPAMTKAYLLMSLVPMLLLMRFAKFRKPAA